MSRLFYLMYVYLVLLHSIETLQKAKDNGDIYVAQEETIIGDKEHVVSGLLPDNSTRNTNNSNSTAVTTSVAPNSNKINFDEVISACNSSFYIPMHYFTSFNTTAELPDLVDKTGMCFIRCLYEKSGLIENWQLNAEKIRANIWPAMGDTIEVCQKEGAEEKNACVRVYAIARCLTLRLLTDARNNPF